MCFQKIEEIKLRKVIKTPEDVSNSFHPLLEKFDQLIADPRVIEIFSKFEIKHYNDKMEEVKGKLSAFMDIEELEAAEKIMGD